MLQHMSSFMGRDLVRYLAARRELPALASPDGTGADGKWARDRRRKYWESTNKRHNAILPCRRRMIAQKSAEWREVSYENRLCKAVDVEVSTLWHPINRGIGTPWRIVFFDDDGVLNCEDTTRSGRAKPVGPLDPQLCQEVKGRQPPHSLQHVDVCLGAKQGHGGQDGGHLLETSAKTVCCSEGRRNSFELRDHLTETLFNAGLPQDACFVPDLESRGGGWWACARTLTANRSGTTMAACTGPETGHRGVGDC